MTDENDSNLAQTKDRVLAVALTLLEKEGARQMTLRRVADKANLAVSVVHHHFASKQGLLDACKASYYARGGELIAAALTEALGKPPLETIDLIVRDVWSFARCNLGVLRLLARDILGDGELIERFKSYDRRPYYAIADHLIAPSLGLSTEVARVRLQAVSVVLVRFAVSSDDDIEALLGYSGDAALAAAEEHVVQMARLLLCGTVASSLPSGDETPR